MTEAPASTRARLAQIAPLDSGGEHPAMGLARHLACTAHYRDALITALPPPAAPSAVNLRNYALAAVHALRTLMYACQNPEVLTPELADQAAREIATAWADGDAGDWTWMHCKALGLDPDEIAGLAEGSARRMAANGAESNGDGPAAASGGERAPEPAQAVLLPAENIALTVAREQLRRGEDPPVNTTTVLVMALDRLAGHDNSAKEATS